MNPTLLTGLALFSAACLSLSAQESRTWTNTKGQTIEGSFVKQDATTVWIKKPDGKEISIPKKSLSAEDLKHLETAAPAPAAGGGGAATGGGAAPGARFASIKFDPAQWKPRDGGFKLDTMLFPSNLETEHFIIGGSTKIRPAIVTAYADAAERLWADIAADFPDFPDSFKGGVKFPIILLNDEKEHKMLAAWHEKHAADSPTVSPMFGMERYTICSVRLDKKFGEENKLSTYGLAFRMDGKGYQHTKPTWPERIHFVSGNLFDHWLGRPKGNGKFSLSLVAFSLAYHREQMICGHIESQVSFGSGSSEVEGFKNGRNWPGATKKLLKGGASPDIKSFLETEASEAQPRDLGFGLGLMQFILKDPTRREGLNKILHEAATSEKSPDDAGFAKGLGFDSPGALNVAWKEYMLSDAFQ